MLGITGFKVALCIAYLRITGDDFKVKKSRYRLLIWEMMVFSIISHLAGILALIFRCSPVRKSWRPLTPGSCLPKVSLYYTLAAITILCDVIIFLLPIPLLLKVPINGRNKIGLVGVFALALFTTVCSVMRMVQIRIISANGNSTNLVLWGTIEMNVGIFFTCLPCLKPLSTIFSSKQRSQTYNSYSRDCGDAMKAGGKNGSMRLQSMTKNSQMTSRISHIDRSDSQENILPLQGEQDFRIFRPPEVEVQPYKHYRRQCGLVHEGISRGGSHG